MDERSVEDIYAVCLTDTSWLEGCKGDAFWKELVEIRYPILGEIGVSGEVYRYIARYIYELKQVLNRQGVTALTIGRVNLYELANYVLLFLPLVRGNSSRKTFSLHVGLLVTGSYIIYGTNIPTTVVSSEDFFPLCFFLFWTSLEPVYNNDEGLMALSSFIHQELH
jgi:hypothetical protein